MLRKAAINLAAAAIFIALPVMALGATAHGWLFSRVSYSNAPEFDAKVKALAAPDARWNVIITGSSEVRWGISPDDFDAGVRAVLPEADVASFNLGVDGFPPGLIYPLLERSDLVSSESGVKVLLIGLNIVESISIARMEYSPGVCGALQKPIFTSAFALDNGLNVLCEEPREPAVLTPLLEKIPVFRYRKPIRALILGQRPRKLGEFVQANGFHPHRPASYEGDYYGKFNQRLEGMRETEPERFAALDPQIWERAVAPGGFFDRYDALARARGWLPAYFALPTNPYSFDVFGKRETYHRTSALIADWASRTGGVYIDLGIMDDYDLNEDYADFRHLSGAGGAKYSRALGEAIARHAQAAKVFQIEE